MRCMTCILERTWGSLGEMQWLAVSRMISLDVKAHMGCLKWWTLQASRVSSTAAALDGQRGLQGEAQQ